jgi:hypothetical protein
MKVLVKEIGNITPGTLCTLPQGGDEFDTLTGERVARAVVADASEEAVREVVLKDFPETLNQLQRALWEPEVVMSDLRWIASVCADYDDGTVFRLKAREDGFALLPDSPRDCQVGLRHVGVVHVDSGAVIVTDPGRVDDFKQDQDLGVDLNELSVRPPRPSGYAYSVGGAWEGRCNTQGAGQLVDGNGRPGAGVVAESGFGDGEYPVFVEYDKETGRVARLVVEFL